MCTNPEACQNCSNCQHADDESGAVAILKLRPSQVAGILVEEYAGQLSEAVVRRLEDVVAQGAATADQPMVLMSELALCDELAAHIAAQPGVNARSQDPVLVGLLVSLAYTAAQCRDMLADGGIRTFREQVSVAGPVAMAGLPTEAEIRTELADEPPFLVEAFLADQLPEIEESADGILHQFISTMLRGRMLEQLVKWGCAPVALSIHDLDREVWVIEQAYRFVEFGDTLSMGVEAVLGVTGVRGLKVVVFGDDGEGFRRLVLVGTDEVVEGFRKGDPTVAKALQPVVADVLGEYFEGEESPIRIGFGVTHFDGDLDDQMNQLARTLFETDLNLIPVVTVTGVGEVDEVVATLVDRFGD